MTLNVGSQTLQLDYHGVNHEPGNIYIYAPHQKALMLVDVVFPGSTPFQDLALAESVDGFLAAHDQILAYDFDHFIGGHLNRIGTRTDVENQKEYFDDIVQAGGKANAAMDFGAAFGEANERGGANNPWALFKILLDSVAQQCADEVEANGVILMVDRFSTVRANGITIELVETAEGNGFKVDNPNAPTLGEMTVQSLKTLLDSNEKFEFIDVRTPSEFETARIPGAVLLDETEYQRMSDLPKQTKIVFICHHGPRGVNAGKQFIGQGFTNVHNVTGGMDAWSTEIDSGIPRY